MSDLHVALLQFPLKAEIAHKAYSSLELATACTEILAVSSEGNVFINNEAPWIAFKSVSVVQLASSQRLRALLLVHFDPITVAKTYRRNLSP
jgi:methionyl-tRNA synthetase